MNEKEVAEIRRRFRQDRSNITHIYGCYVNDRKEILSQFDQPVSMLGQEDTEKFLSILKKSLSGSLGRNLIDIGFSTQQVVHSQEHKLLMTLRNSSLKDEKAVKAFFEQVVVSLSLEGDYLILLAHDAYDVPFRSKDDQHQADHSAEVFSYIICSICPMKPTKPALSYAVHTNEFHSLRIDKIVAAPELGFIFPAFDDRGTNLYGALYYTRDVKEGHEEFTDAVFHSAVPMPALVQKETFQAMLRESLADDCNLETVEAVREQLSVIIAEHKESKVPQPLMLSKAAVRGVLQACGLTAQQADEFETRYEAEFGADAALSPKNLVNAKLEVCTPDVTISVKPERSELLETRVINGTKYILIRADENVEVNGVAVHIT